MFCVSKGLLIANQVNYFPAQLVELLRPLVGVIYLAALPSLPIELQKKTLNQPSVLLPQLAVCNPDALCRQQGIQSLKVVEPLLQYPRFKMALFLLFPLHSAVLCPLDPLHPPSLILPPYLCLISASCLPPLCPLFVSSLSHFCTAPQDCCE